MTDIGRRVVVLRTMAEIAAQMVAQGDWGDEYVAEATAFAQRLNAEARALEAPRTPGTVLRAMLKAYEEWALRTEEHYVRRFRDPGTTDAERNRLAWESGNSKDHVDELRSHVVRLSVRGTAPKLSASLQSDYDARLSGAKALDALPGET